MNSAFLRLAYAALVALGLSAHPAAAQDKADKGGATRVATVNGVAIPKSRVDIVVRAQAQRGVPDSEQMRNEIKEQLDRLKGDHVVAVDDFEVIGTDSQVGMALSEHFGRMRDTGSLMVVSGSIDDMGNVYRGLPNDLKRGRSGLILSPRSANDGDALNVRLPRSASGMMPVGRGVLANPTGWTWVQVPRMP